MNIQPLNFLSFKSIPKTDKIQNIGQHLYVSNPILKKDTFTKSNDFDLNSCVYKLSQIKGSKNKPKLNNYYLETIKTELKTEPKKWDAINSLANNPKINGEFVFIISTQPLDKLNELKFYSEVKNEKGEPKYDGKALMNFNDKANTEDLAKVRPLTKTSLSPKNIVAISQEKDFPNISKLADKILEIEKEYTSNILEISAQKDNYKNNEILVTTKLNNNEASIKAFDKNLNLIYDEKEINNNNKKIQTKLTNDYRNNTTSEITSRLDDYVGRPVVLSEKRIIKDKNNETIRIEEMKPSVIEGVLNVTHTDKDGNVKIISSGTIDKETGIMSVKKNMTSFDGTKTNYLYENDPEGNRILDYKITDKNGKTLLNISEAFEVINKNKFITSKNNEKYQIDVTEQEITVQDLKNKERKANFKIGKELKGDSKLLIKTLKQLSGAELIKLRENVDTLQSLDESLDSFYQGATKTISTGDNAYLLIHEIGHAVDFKNTDSSSNDKYKESLVNSISLNKEVNNVYQEELNNFLNAFPNTQRNHIDYFINKTNHIAGENGAIGETIAESNALTNTPKTVEALAYRAHYLQQYFPKTIAEVAKRLN